jgi:signal transduction histidine kinase/CheY-like chemotaxis protein
MSPNAVTLYGLITNLLATVLGLAVMFIALWQNVRARLNQYLAAMMGMLALWGFFGALIYVAQFLDIDGEFLVNVSTSFYMFAILALFFFITEFEKENRRRLIEGRLLAAFWLIIIIGITWSGHFWTDVTPREHGEYSFQASHLGMAVVAAGVASLGFVALIRGFRISEELSPLRWAILPIFIGGTAFALRLPLSGLINGTFSQISMILVARVILKDQLFNPLVELYNQLTSKNAQLEEATRRKSEFLANMSHELRTPLNSIIGYTELVTGGTYGPLNQTQSDRLEKVNQNGKRLLALINNVLDLSKIDAGRLDIHPNRVAPTVLIDEVMNTLQPLADQKGLHISRGYYGLPSMFVDEVRARQIILNVIANAIKFTPAGGVTIGGYLDATRHQVVISVRDTGIGIKAEDADKIFKAFEYWESPAARQDEGTGLGLTVSKRLVELHGGRIWFESTPQHGSIFYIALPAALDSQMRIQPVVAQPTILVDGRRPLVLVIDDDPEAIEVIQGYLNRDGYQAYAAFSGREGLLRARELNPSVITLDIVMPGMDGWAVLEVLKTDPDLKSIPVIILSMAEQQDLAKELGCFACLAKPVSRRALAAVVQSAYLQWRELQEQNATLPPAPPLPPDTPPTPEPATISQEA